MTSNQRALTGRRIVITRAPEQAVGLAELLRAAGAEILFLPTVQFLDPQDFTDLDAEIKELRKFDWLVFTSANAARFFLKRCRERDQWPKENKPRIAAVGLATEAVVAAEQLPVAFVPQEANAATLAAEMASEVDGKTVLLPRSNHASDTLPVALCAAGAKVTEVIAYRNETVEIDPSERAALLHGNADAITFFSPSAFHHFAEGFEPAELEKMNRHAVFAAVGPVTASAIRKAGYEVAVEAAEASSAAVVAALSRHFAMLAIAKEPA